jgi:small-conductance mechanosensitive channel
MRQTLLSALLSALLAICLVLPATAQAPAAPPSELDQVLQLLQNDSERQAFAEKLRALIAASRAAQPAAPEPPTPVGLVGGLLASLTAGLAAVSAGLSNAGAALGDMPAVINWFERQVRDPEQLAWWGALLWKIAAVLIIGWLAERLVRMTLAPALKRLGAIVPRSMLIRVALVLTRLGIGLLGVLGFAAGAYATLAVVDPTFTTRLVALALVNAALIVRGASVLLDALLQPRSAPLRLLPLGDDAAAYLYVWLRRLIAIAVYGAFALQAAFLLGLAAGAVAALQRVLGLTIATMIAILILQNRAIVAGWIKGRSAWPEGQAAPRLRRILHRGAEFWHVIALAYVAGLFLIWALGIPGGFAYLLRVTVLTGVILTAVHYAAHAIDWLIRRGFSVGDELSQRLPDLQSRADRYLPLLNGVLRGTMWLIAAIVLLQIWGVNSFAWLSSAAGRGMVASAVTITLAVGAALAAWEVISAAIERFLAETDPEGRPLARSGRVRTLLPLVRNALMVVLVVFTTLIVLSELGVNIAPLLAGAGVIGLAIGFGAQTLVRDVITGLFILFEDTIRVGDVVSVSGKSGTVEAINIRGIRLRDAAGNVISIPFGSVGDVTNMTRDFAFASFDIPIEIGRDLSTAKATLATIDTDLRADPVISTWLLGPLTVLGIDRFEGGLFFLRAQIKTVPGKQWAISREVNLRLQAGFIDKGVWVPAVPPTGALPGVTG